MTGRLCIGLATTAAVGCTGLVRDWSSEIGPAVIEPTSRSSPTGASTAASAPATTAPATTAPSIWWRTHAGTDTSARDSAIDVALAPNGRAIVLARLAQRVFGVIAYEPDGTLAWVSDYRDPSDDADVATKIAVDTSGNIYAAGSWQRSDAPLGGFLVVAFEAGGALRWAARSAAGGALSGLAVDGGGHVVVTGGGSDGAHSLTRTIAYDGAGRVAWEASELGPLGLGGVGRAVVCDRKGRTYVAGETTDGMQNHLTLFAYDARGTCVWATRRDDDPEHVPETTVRALAIDASGAPHVAFTRAFRVTRDSEPDIDLAVTKLDTTGATEWTATVREAARNIARAIAVDPSGRVTVTGFAGNPGPDSYLTAQFDAAGHLQWTDRYRWGAQGQHEATALALDPTGRAYVAGTAYAADGVGCFGSLAYDSFGGLLFREVDGDPSNASRVAAALAVDRSGALYIVGSVLSAPRGVVGVLRSSR